MDSMPASALRTIREHRALAAYVLCLVCLYGLAVAISTQLSSIADADVVALGLTLDLLLWPVVGYLFVARRYGWPLISAVPVFMLSLVVAHQVLPEEHQSALSLTTRIAVPLVEIVVLSVLAFTVHRTRKLLREARAQDPSHDDFFDLARFSLRQTLPAPVSEILASELALFHYAFFGWRKSPPVGPRDFSHHRTGLSGVLTAGLILATLVEIIPVHLLLHRWSSTLAWLVTALTVYGLFWLFGDFQAMRLRPHRVVDGKLHLRLGLRWSVDVPLADIVRLETLKGNGKPPAKQPDLKAVALGEQRYLIELRRPVFVRGLYGLRREVRSIGFTVDNPARFEEELRAIAQDSEG